jgi:hypothetical protein
MHLSHTRHALIAILGGLLLFPAQSLGQTSSNASQATTDAETRDDEDRPLAFVRQYKPQVDIFNRASQKYAEADQAIRWLRVTTGTRRSSSWTRALRR